MLVSRVVVVQWGQVVGFGGVVILTGGGRRLHGRVIRATYVSFVGRRRRRVSLDNN